MKKDAEQIAAEICNLVAELATLAGVAKAGSRARKRRVKATAGRDRSGATGGIRLLVEEGKLDSPKPLPEIIEALKQEGRHYLSQTVSMGLLNLVRERVLTRIRDKGNKKWKYVIRR
jgi:hypothetical protein